MSHAPKSRPDVSFSEACSLVETILNGDSRQRILETVAVDGAFGLALSRLRERMRTHVWQVGPRQIRLGRLVAQYDQRAREGGFHLLHDWDGKADRVNEDIIPVDVLHFLGVKRGQDDYDSTSAAILLDYYLLYVLTLMSLAIWDDGDADANLDRLDAMVRELSGAGGSGQRFVDDAETLFLLAGSHYELADHGYDALLTRVRTLNTAHQLKIALGHAAGLGSHLRFGFEATYGKSVAAMRADNVVDYPWLLFSLSTLIDEYARIADAAGPTLHRGRIVEALFNGLSADVEAFLGEAPPALVSLGDEHARFTEAFAQHRASLTTDFERLRQADDRYSPFSFFFNFSQNVIKGAVVDALLWGSPWTISLNDLLTGLPPDDDRAGAKEKLARIMMAYARSSPDRVRGRLMPAIVYDLETGRKTTSGVVFRIS